jgi:hypothetical protein
MTEPDERRAGRIPRGGTGTVARPRREPGARPRRPEPDPRQEQPKAPPRPARPRPESRPEAQEQRARPPRHRVPPQFYSAPAAPPAPGMARPGRDQGARPGQQATTRPRPATGARPAAARQQTVTDPPSPPAAPQRSRVAAQRVPFLLLVCGLLGGALVSALVISTTLAQGSFRITQLQQQDSQLDRTRQQLEYQVTYDSSGPVIYQQAYALGLRTQGVLRFLDLKDGRTETDAGGAGTTGYVP